MPTLLDRRVFVPSPQPGIAVLAAAYATEPTGTHLLRIATEQSRSDTCEVAFLARSHDAGLTWQAPQRWPMRFDHPAGVGRLHPRGLDIDPRTQRCIMVWTQGVLPTDNPLEGMFNWTLWYAVSNDAGATFTEPRQIIHDGPGYDAKHHLPGITVGSNCCMMGDLGQRIMPLPDGDLLLPIQVSLADEHGRYWNPTGGLTWTACQTLRARWRDDHTLSWTAGARLDGDPQRTTRGLIEPTLARLADGSLLMVMRGSNTKRLELPSYRWCSRSMDEGMTWSPAEPWTDTQGQPFFSPSSCSQLVPIADGRLFWIGNICGENAQGNSPRYPLCLVEVDQRRGQVIRESCFNIDDRQPDESPHLTLSNFYCRQDPRTGHLLLYMTRLFARDFRVNKQMDWTADALEYRIALD